MSIIFASIVGYHGSFVPEAMKMVTDVKDKKHELDVMKLQMKQQSQGHRERMAEIDMQADIAEVTALYGTKEPKSGVPFIDGLRGSVRPVLTYAFFILYAGVKVAQYQLLTAPILPWQDASSAAQALVAIWTSEDMALFAGIISYWFGSRGIEKARRAYV
jgi:hypothetical protein